MFLSAAAPADLAHSVRLFWAAERPTAGAPERVVPDGCCEMIVNVGAPHRLVHAGRPQPPQPPAFLFGQLQEAIVIEPTGWTSMVAVRFSPGGVGRLFGFDVRELGARAVALDALFGHRAVELADRVREADTVQARWQLLVDFLRRAAVETAAASDSVDYAAARLCRPGMRVSAIARELGLSMRTLERRVRAGVGLSPRQLARVARIDRAARQLRAGNSPLTDVALAAGFADQPHFTREFSRIVGVTPARYARELGLALLVP